MSRAWKDFLKIFQEFQRNSQSSAYSASMIVTLIKIQGWAENSVEIARSGKDGVLQRQHEVRFATNYILLKVKKKEKKEKVREKG